MKFNIKEKSFLSEPITYFKAILIIIVGIFLAGIIGLIISAFVILFLFWVLNKNRFSANKKGNYVKPALFFTTFLMVIAAITVAGILGIFVYRLASGDRTTSNFRQLQIQLNPVRPDQAKSKLVKKNNNESDKNADYYYPSGLISNNANVPPPKYDGYIYNQSGEFVTYNTPMPLFVFIHFWDAASFGFLFWILYMLRKFLLSIMNENPFTLENIRILEIIAYMIVIAPVFDTMVIQYAFYYFLSGLNFGKDLVPSYSTHLVPQMGILFAGLIGLAIVRVIKNGLIIKQENDLTV